MPAIGRRSNRLPLSVLAAALAAALIGDTLLWRWAEQDLDAGFAAWVADRRAEGWTVSAGPPAHGGWPLSAELRVPELSVFGGTDDIPSGIAWSAERLVLKIALLQPTQLALAAGGMQRLRVGDAADVPFTADSFAAVVPLAPDPPPEAIDLAARNLRVGLPPNVDLPDRGAAGGLMIAGLTLRARMKPTAPRSEAALDASLSALDIALPPAPGGAAWALGTRIASLNVDAALGGPLPSLTVPSLPGLRAEAGLWRDGGGTLRLPRIALAWGPLGLTGHATLALDEVLQPKGTATLHLVGQSETLDALAAAHVLALPAATAAKAILALMAKAPPGGGAATVDVPLTLQNRALAMGQIPLARVPELVWPSRPQ